MAGITLVHAEEQLNYWLENSKRLAENKAYKISSGSGSRELERAEAHTLEMIEFWDKKCRILSGTAPDGTTRSGIPVRGVIPID